MKIRSQKLQKYKGVEKVIEQGESFGQSHYGVVITVTDPELDDFRSSVSMSFNEAVKMFLELKKILEM